MMIIRPAIILTAKYPKQKASIQPVYLSRNIQPLQHPLRFRQTILPPATGKLATTTLFGVEAGSIALSTLDSTDQFYFLHSLGIQSNFCSLLSDFSHFHIALPPLLF